MERLNGTETLFVHQKKEWGEILTGFETKNKYEILDSSNQQMYLAAEESSVLARLALKSLRPFTMHILAPEGLAAIKASRPFRFYFHEINIMDSQGTFLGKVKREFSILSKKFTIEDAQGIEIYKIFGPIFHPWTFKILKSDNEVGKILKKWSGLGKEAFTDSDNFSINFPAETDTKQKAILLGALFLIDMLYFERK